MKFIENQHFFRFIWGDAKSRVLKLEDGGPDRKILENSFKITRTSPRGATDLKTLILYSSRMVMNESFEFFGKSHLGAVWHSEIERWYSLPALFLKIILKKDLF